MPEFPDPQDRGAQRRDLSRGRAGRAKEPRRRAAAMAVVKNPFAGRYVEELQSAMDDLKPLGLLLDRPADRRTWRRRRSRSTATARAPSSASAGETGAWRAVACAGRLRHARAARRRQGDRALGHEGRRLRLAARRAARPHQRRLCAQPFRRHGGRHQPTARAPDEILFCLAMTCGPRIHNRMGGLAADGHQGLGRAAVSGEDNLLEAGRGRRRLPTTTTCRSRSASSCARRTSAMSRSSPRISAT